MLDLNPIPDFSGTSIKRKEQVYGKPYAPPYKIKKG
jgi:hypothetical protein